MAIKKTKKQLRREYKEKLARNSSYNKLTYKSYSFRLNIESESDLISWLDDVPDKKAYFTRLIIMDQKREARRQRKNADQNI